MLNLIIDDNQFATVIYSFNLEAAGDIPGHFLKLRIKF